MPVPVILFVYNRADHTSQTLEALLRNDLASETELFVFSDGAKNDKGRLAVDATRAIVNSITGFSSVTIAESPVNLGCAKSVIAGVTEIFRRHESVIVLEDDIVTSKHFLSYMNEALEIYRDDPMAFSVTGHTYPPEFLQIPEDYNHDVYPNYRCSSWSWGTWRDRWQLVDWDMAFYKTFRNCPPAITSFNRGGSDLTEILRMEHDGEIDTWDIQFSYAHQANDMRCIYPIKPLIRNIGLDDSGTHSKPNPRYLNPRLDETWRPLRFCSASNVDERISSSFRSIFGPSTTSTEEQNTDLKHSNDSFLERGRRLLKRVGLPSAKNTSGTSVAASLDLQSATPRKADVVVVNTFQGIGGAARAAFRTYLGIKGLYPNAHFACLLKKDDIGDITGFFEGSSEAAHILYLMGRDQKRLGEYPGRQPGFFSPGASANPLRTPLTRFAPDLVHLNWVAMTMLRVEDLSALKVPLVWTLHDAWAFTGGCHYLDGCTRFENMCGTCPQLGSLLDKDLSRSLWKRKRSVYDDLNLTLVTPSKWLASLARKSSLFHNSRIEVIPNGLDTHVFRPYSKRHSKAKLSFDPSKPVILFGSHVLGDHRKGSDLLNEALGQIDFACTLVVFGSGSMDLCFSDHVTIRSLGEIIDENALAEIYSAADVFVCPSREDNLPNTVAEALACGTPCVAFRIGGLPEMVEHQVSGWLAEPFDPVDLAKGIRWVALHPQPDSLQKAARDRAVAEYDVNVVSERYSTLYRSLRMARTSVHQSDTI